MNSRVLIVLLLLCGFALPNRAAAEQTAFDRRLTVVCPDIKDDQYGVELEDLFSDIDLANIVDVVDETDAPVSWQISPDRHWVVFEGRKGERYDLLISEKEVSLPPGQVKALPGRLTLTANEIWVRGMDAETRAFWFSNRVARVTGAVQEARGDSAIKETLAQYQSRLASLGIEHIEPGQPYDPDRKLVSQYPTFAELLDKMINLERQARAEVFAAARRVIRQHDHAAQTTQVASVRPWQLPAGRGLAAMLSGRMRFEKETSFVMTAYSLFGGVLRIDGKDIAVIRPCREIQPDGWWVSVPVTLAAGEHDIALIAQGNRQDYKAGLTWVAPGETQERHMVAEDFGPAPRVRIDAFTSADRSREYVLCKMTRYGRTDFFENTRYWANLRSLNGPLEWRINGFRKTSAGIDFCVPKGKPVEVAFDHDAFTIDLNEERFRFLGGAPEIRLALPPFLFRNETLQGKATLLSEAEVPLGLHLSLKHMRPGKQPRSLLNETCSLRGRGARVAAPLEPTGRRVSAFALSGSQIAAGERLHLNATCPPVLFADEVIRVLAPDQCQNVTSSPHGHLVNADGERVLIRLTRPTLSEKRSWGLISGLIASTQTPSHILVVAGLDEWGNNAFKHSLESAAHAHEIEVSLHDWRRTPAGVPRMLGSIGAIIKHLKSSEADAVLIIPPLADLAEGQAERILSRSAACLLEMCTARYGRENVWLALPPAYRPDVRHSRTFEKKLLRVIKDYGAQVIPLAQWLETLPGQLASAYEIDGIVQKGPVRMHAPVAGFLMGWISGERL